MAHNYDVHDWCFCFSFEYYLGPADYETLPKKRQLGGVIDSEKPRFKSPKNTNPGPGEYEVSRKIISEGNC